MLKMKIKKSFHLNIFKFLSWPLGYVGGAAGLETSG